MERTTVYLDPELKRKLKEAAVRARVSEARLIREALASYLSKEAPVMLEPVGRSKDGGIAADDEAALEDLEFGRT
jgi:metal-responsive CopG/Arc/MetJ family transcriptional regulator